MFTTNLCSHQSIRLCRTFACIIPADGDECRSVIGGGRIAPLCHSFAIKGGTPVRITKAGYKDLDIAVEISSEHRDPITLVMVKQAKPPR